MADIAIGLHGGCGTLSSHLLSPAEWAESRDHLAQALRAGWQILRASGSALDAVQAAVVVMEDSPHFNAGHGAALTETGEHELDASIMDGATRACGAVTGVSRTKSPIQLARAVMEKSPHVLLVGRGAEQFARKQGLQLASEKYFHTQSRLEALRKGLARHHGTVGAVALDRRGDLAAATSTGGYTGKLPGRVGDSPLIGAGTYADNSSCAVSGTGWGEAFIRIALAHEVSARMRHKGEDITRASKAALRILAGIKGDGGLIALDRRGNVAMPFNSEGMLRACVRADGRRVVKIYR